METKAVYITVAMQVRKDADPQEVVAELDYNITHPDVVSTEIVDQRTTLDNDYLNSPEYEES